MRIQVNLSDEMNEKVNEYSKKFGVTKSQFCSMVIGQAVMSYDNALDIMGSMKDVISEQLKKSIDTVNENK